MHLGLTGVPFWALPILVFELYQNLQRADLTSGLFASIYFGTVR